ncbi:transcriptional regulator [Solibacillus silvestris]|uniref:transcriptional regulator n=1 Tax=Solibacillus silvestris TaxID=76853 RepID=UPI003F7F7939
MNDHQIGYEHYKEACEKHHSEPVNFHYYLLNLSEQQLNAFKDYAMLHRGQHELTNQ